MAPYESDMVEKWTANAKKMGLYGHRDGGPGDREDLLVAVDGFVKQGVTWKGISRITNISASTINRWYRDWQCTRADVENSDRVRGVDPRPGSSTSSRGSVAVLPTYDDQDPCDELDGAKQADIKRTRCISNFALEIKRQKVANDATETVTCGRGAVCSDSSVCSAEADVDEFGFKGGGSGGESDDSDVENDFDPVEKTKSGNQVTRYEDRDEMKSGDEEHVGNSQRNTVADHVRSLFNNELQRCDLPSGGSPNFWAQAYLYAVPLVSHIVFQAGKLLLFRDSKSNLYSVVVSGMGRKTFLALLQYAYTDSLDVSDEDLVDLFGAADQYEMESLKELCSQRLAKLVRVDNVAEILQAAAEHNDTSLRDACFSYMLRNLEAAQKTQSLKDMAVKNTKSCWRF